MASRACASEGVHRTAPSPEPSSPEAAALSVCTTEGLRNCTAPSTLAVVTLCLCPSPLPPPAPCT
eukprot:8330055-Alexandrium_andersonii.AAC.1